MRYLKSFLLWLIPSLWAGIIICRFVEITVAYIRNVPAGNYGFYIGSFFGLLFCLWIIKLENTCR